MCEATALQTEPQPMPYLAPKFKQKNIVKGNGAQFQWLWEDTQVREVVKLNLCATYWIDNFPHLFDVKLY